MFPTNESLSEKFIKRGFWLYLFAFLTGPIGYFIKIILSRDLSVEEVGILYGVLSLFALAIAYHDLGLTESLNYFLPKCIIRKDWGKMKFTLTIALVAQLVSSVLLGTAFYFGAAYLGEHFFRDTKAVETIRILVVFFFGSNIAGIISAIFGAFQDTKWMKSMELVRMSSVLWMAGWLWVTDNGNLETYAHVWIYGLVVAIAFGGTVLYRKYYRPYLSDATVSWDGEYFQKVAKYAWFVFLTQNAWTVLSQVDTLLIIYLLGNTDNGYYSNYLSLIGIPFIFITPLIAFLFPVISAMEKDQSDKIRYIGTFFYKYFSVIGIAIGWFFLFAGPQLAIILFGEKFEFSGRILQYSAPFILFNFLIQINFQILAGIGQIKDRVKSILVGIAFNLPLNIVLIHLMKEQWLGAAGSSLAVGLSWIPLFLVSYYKLWSFRPQFDFGFFAKNCLVTALLVLPLMAFKDHLFVANEPIRDMLAKLAAIWLFYAFGIMFTNRSDIRFFIDEIKKIRSAKK